MFGSAIQIWQIEIWSPIQATTTVLQLSHLAYGLGTISSPVLASSFVYGKANVTRDGAVLTPDLRKHNLLIPFGINAVIQVIRK